MGEKNCAGGVYLGFLYRAQHLQGICLCEYKNEEFKNSKIEILQDNNFSQNLLFDKNTK